MDIEETTILRWQEVITSKMQESGITRTELARSCRIAYKTLESWLLQPGVPSHRTPSHLQRLGVQVVLNALIAQQEKKQQEKAPAKPVKPALQPETQPEAAEADDKAEEEDTDPRIYWPKELEPGPFAPPGGAPSKCFSCGGVLNVGDMAVKRLPDKRSRHVGCPPKKVKRAYYPPMDATGGEEALRRAMDQRHKAGDKRRRSGGHGYSGGSSMSNL